MVSSNSIALILHLLSDHSILVPVPIIRALIIPVRHDPHIVVLVHVHVAQIRPVFIVIDVECTSLAAYPLFVLLPHVFLSSAFSDPPVNISLTDILTYYTGFYRLWHHLSHIFFPSYAFNALVFPLPPEL